MIVHKFTFSAIMTGKNPVSSWDEVSYDNTGELAKKNARLESIDVVIGDEG